MKNATVRNRVMKQMGKSKLIQSIEEIFKAEEKSILPFEAIREKLGLSPPKVLGTLSSNKKIFQKVAKNLWRPIPDELDSLDSICNDMGIENSEIKKYMSDDGNIRYSFIQVKKTKGKYHKREIFYLVYRLKKDFVLDPPSNYLSLANTP